MSEVPLRCAESQSSAKTSPASPSTTTRIPSRKTVVAFFVATTHGMPISRATIDGCDVIPPMSQTIAAARFIRGVIVGSVMRVTSISPSLKATWSFIDLITLTLPRAVPGLAAMPFNKLRKKSPKTS